MQSDVLKANNKSFVLDATMEAGDWETGSFYSRNRIRGITARSPPLTCSHSSQSHTTDSDPGANTYMEEEGSDNKRKHVSQAIL
jgi:hypothetical protein